MTDHYDKIIEDADAKLRVKEIELADIRKFINQVCEFAGRPPRYTADELLVGGEAQAERGPKEITRNEFYGRPLAACVRDYLERRMRGGGIREATLDEIFSALEQGNYDLKKHGDSRDAMRRGVAISLAKNSKAFHKLPNGDWGLAEWYARENLRREKKNGKGGGEVGPDVSDDDSNAEADEENSEFEESLELSDDESSEEAKSREPNEPPF